MSNKRASVKNWHNGDSTLTAIELARCFLSSTTLPAELKQLGERALNRFRNDPVGAKRMVNSHTAAEFSCEVDYLQWAQFKALFLKSTAGGSEKARRSKAIAGFLASEGSCRRANRRLRFYWRYPDRENPLYRVILTRAKGLISDALGNLSEAVLEEIYRSARPGSGVAGGTNDRRFVSLPYKLGGTALHVTDEARPYSQAMVESSSLWLQLNAEINWVDGTYTVPYVASFANRVAFVPKDATILRSIAVEPHLNMCLQLGVHEYISRRLRAVGVDLSTQSRNQAFARKGARLWCTADPIATLDLSAASDSVSVAVVERLVPTAWRELLDDLRSKRYTMEGGDPVEYQKWSSMGNGYTFVLETLIFWGLSRACLSLTDCIQEVAVYGDDIALPRSAALLLIEVLKYCGFSINRDKSFVTGPFRESCGEDFFASARVTPVYFRNRCYLRPTDLYKIVNGLRELGIHSQEVESLCRKAHRGRPILYGQNVGDPSSCWHVDLAFLKRAKLVRWLPEVQAYEQRVAVFKPYTRAIPPLWGFAAALLGQKNMTESVTAERLIRDILRGREVDHSEVKAAEKAAGLWATASKTTG